MRAKPFSQQRSSQPSNCSKATARPASIRWSSGSALKARSTPGRRSASPRSATSLGASSCSAPDQVLATLDGTLTLGEAMVREAIQLLRAEPGLPLEQALRRGLARDGYVVSFDDDGHDPMLRAALPDEVQLPGDRQRSSPSSQVSSVHDATRPSGSGSRGAHARRLGGVQWPAPNLFRKPVRRHCPEHQAAGSRTAAQFGEPARALGRSERRLPCCRPERVDGRRQELRQWPLQDAFLRARTLGSRTRITAPFACISSSSRPGPCCAVSAIDVDHDTERHWPRHWKVHCSAALQKSSLLHGWIDPQECRMGTTSLNLLDHGDPHRRVIPSRTSCHRLARSAASSPHSGRNATWTSVQIAKAASLFVVVCSVQYATASISNDHYGPILCGQFIPSGNPMIRHCHERRGRQTFTTSRDGKSACRLKRKSAKVSAAIGRAK